MRIRIRQILAVLAITVGVILFGGLSQPSAGQITGREGACGCFICYFPGVKSLYVNFPDPPENCAGILARDACPTVMAQMPDKGKAYCQKIKKELGITSF